MRETNLVWQLQLTQSASGQITGVLTSVQLTDSGTIDSQQVPITGGATDGPQLTLTLNGGLATTNLSGTVRAGLIQLQTVAPNGDVARLDFKRGSPDEFKTYADQLKATGNARILTASLLKNTQELRELIQETEQWIANAELHAQRIPGVKDYYRKIEDAIRELIARERVTANSVARSQICVKVSQADVVGVQEDLASNQTWDIGIVDPGQTLSRSLVSEVSQCSAPENVRQPGVTPSTVESWEKACLSLFDERRKFDAAFIRMMQQRDQLKAIQAMAQSSRQALVDEAYRLQ